MKLDTRRSHSTQHSIWLLFALIWLACSSCISFGNISVECVPADLGANAEPSLVIWSLNAEGTQFNSLVTSSATGVMRDDTTRTFAWPSGLSQSLPPKIGSVSVLLDPSPSAELRRHVHELLMEIERTNPAVITSVTVCADRVGVITNGQQFAEEMMRLHDATAAQRMNLGIAPVMRFDLTFSHSAAPQRIVIPNAAILGEYFVASGPSSYAPVAISAENAEVRSVRAEHVLEELKGDGGVVFLQPFDEPLAVAQATRSLICQLEPHATPIQARRGALVEWPTLYSELSSVEAVRLTLAGRLGSIPLPAEADVAKKP